jgi:hypothetical protein
MDKKLRRICIMNYFKISKKLDEFFLEKIRNFDQYSLENPAPWNNLTDLLNELRNSGHLLRGQVPTDEGIILGANYVEGNQNDFEYYLVINNFEKEDDSVVAIYIKQHPVSDFSWDLNDIGFNSHEHWRGLFCFVKEFHNIMKECIDLLKTFEVDEENKNLKALWKTN